MINPDLTYYGLFLANMSSQRYDGQPESIPPEATLTFKSNAGGAETHIDQFASDMEVMNKVRMSVDPAVKAAYEQMLTVMALTKGRVYEDDNGTVTTYPL